MGLGCAQAVQVESYSSQGPERVWWSTRSLATLLPSPEAGVGLGLQPGRRRCLLGRPPHALGGLGFWTGQAGGSPRPREPWPSGSGGLRRRSSGAGKTRASALLPIFPVSVLYCFLLLKLTCLIGNWCRIVSRGLLWNISTAVSFN